MKFSHVFITRPRQESEELAALLAPLGLTCVVQPAFTYQAVDARASQQDLFDEMAAAGGRNLIVFSSPRAVAHGLAQLPDEILFRSRIAAIGPATASALSAAGVSVTLTSRAGYTSEALLETLASDAFLQPAGDSCAFIIAAPGGRTKLLAGLGELGWNARLLMVYRPEPADLDKPSLNALEGAAGVLTVWTSANAMKALAQRLPPATWFQLCQGEWLVISERLKRLSRAYGPAAVHLAKGPGNSDLLSAIRGLI